MNPSNFHKPHKCKKFLPYALVYLTGSLILLYVYRSIMIFPLASDALAYAKQIETGAITSWWSALFMYECRFVLHMLRFILGEYIPVELSIYLAYAVCICVMVSAMHVVLKMVEDRGVSSFVPACIMCGCAVFAYLAGPGSFLNVTMLDAPASALLFSAAVFTLKIHCGMGKKKLYTWLSLILILMVHACSYRTPYLMVGGLMSLYLGYVLEPKRTLLRVLARCALMCVSFYACVAFVNQALPPYEHRDDTMRPMFESDMKISAILEGDGGFMDRLAKENSLEISSKEEVIMRFNLISAHYGYLNGAEVWPVLKGTYARRWREKTELMVEARLIQMFHFLTGDYTPAWFKKLVAYKYPHVKVSGTVLDRYEWPRTLRKATLGYMIALLVCLSGVISPLLPISSKRVCLGTLKPMLLYVSVLCASSIACYLTVVVPTSDFRYRMQALLLSSLALSMTWCVISPSMRWISSKASELKEERAA